MCCDGGRIPRMNLSGTMQAYARGGYWQSKGRHVAAIPSLYALQLKDRRAANATRGPTHAPTAGPTAAPAAAGPSKAGPTTAPTAVAQATHMLEVTFAGELAGLNATARSSLGSQVRAAVVAHSGGRIAASDVGAVLLRAGSIVAAVSFGPAVSEDDIRRTAASMAAAPVRVTLGASTLRSIGVQTKQAAPAGDAGEDEAALLSRTWVRVVAISAAAALVLLLACGCIWACRRRKRDPARPPARRERSPAKRESRDVEMNPAAAARRRQMADPTTRQIALNAARNQQRAQRASTPPRSTAPTARKQPPSLDDVPAAHGRKQPPSLGHEPPALWKQPPSLGHAGHRPPALP